MNAKQLKLQSMNSSNGPTIKQRILIHFLNSTQANIGHMLIINICQS